VNKNLIDLVFPLFSLQTNLLTSKLVLRLRFVMEILDTSTLLTNYEVKLVMDEKKLKRLPDNVQKIQLQVSFQLIIGDRLP
jgi:hypothetical protein